MSQSSTGDRVAPVLQVSDLVVQYEGRRGILFSKRPSTAVRGVSFQFGAGTTYGLVGESGSGKSTIGRAILRLVRAHSGSIMFNGTDITSWHGSTPQWYRKAVQVIFQDPLNSLNPRLTVRDIVQEPVRFHFALSRNDARARVRELLDSVGLGAHLEDKYPSELSGGQQQRVAIARALSTEPMLIVCDEPVSALDVSTQSQVINLLRDLQESRGLSYLFISHDLSVVRHISTTVGVLKEGQLVESGDAQAVYDRPQHDYTKELISAIPDITAALRGGRGPEHSHQRQWLGQHALPGTQ